MLYSVFSQTLNSHKKAQKSQTDFLVCFCGSLWLFGGAAVEQQFVIPDVAIVTVEGGEGVGCFFEHLLGHRNGVAELLEIQ